MTVGGEPRLLGVVGRVEVCGLLLAYYAIAIAIAVTVAGVGYHPCGESPAAA